MTDKGKPLCRTKNCSRVIWSKTNLTRTILGLKPGPACKKTATNHISHGSSKMSIRKLCSGLQWSNALLVLSGKCTSKLQIAYASHVSYSRLLHFFFFFFFSGDTALCGFWPPLWSFSIGLWRFLLYFMIGSFPFFFILFFYLFFLLVSWYVGHCLIYCTSFGW
jgi:hypothetical protein